MAGKGTKPKGGKGRRSRKRGRRGMRGGNLLTPAAMLNAYYISHNAAAFLAFRGYPWPGSGKKKRKKKK